MATVNRYRKTLLAKLRLDPSLIKAEGNRLHTVEHGIVRDYLSQYGALPFGHNPAFARAAVVDHLDALAPVFTQPVYQSITERLAARLIACIGGDYEQCVFTNSGAEAVEAGLKLARMKTGRVNVLSVSNSFHGKTHAALSATGSDRYNSSHLRDPDVYQRVVLNDHEGLRTLLASGTFAAFIVEPVMGEGGMHVADREWLCLARQLCSDHGTVLIMDEVQTGLGRIGAMSVAADLAIQPDVLLLAKSLSAGLIPTGAALVHRRTVCPEFDRKHSSTFANNGLAAAVGLAVLDQLTKDDNAALQHVRELSARVDQHCHRLCQSFPSLFSWRGHGLMRSLQFRDDHAGYNYFIGFLQNSGALSWLLCSYLLANHRMLTMPLLSDPCSIRFEPPLNVAMSDIDDFFAAIERICLLIGHGRYDHLLAALVDKDMVAAGLAECQAIPVSEPLMMAPLRSIEGGRRRGKRFAFLMHVTSIPDLIRCMPLALRTHYSQQELERLATLVVEIGSLNFSGAVALEFAVGNDTVAANGVMIMSAISAEDMVKLSQAEKRNLITDWLDVAREHGAEVIGLGAYSSVITRGGATIVDICHDLTLTTGNSLTALATTHAISELSGHDLIGRTVCVIGARGSVGKLIVSDLAHFCDHLILVGRPGSANVMIHELLPILCGLAIEPQRSCLPGSVIDRLAGLARRSPHASGALTMTGAELSDLILTDGSVAAFGIHVDDDAESALRRCDYVISATSEGKSFLNVDSLRPGSIAIDTARPFDFIVPPGSQVEVIEGGLVRQPHAVLYGDCNMVGCPAGINLACLSETIVLALSGASGHFSIGKSIGYGEARMIFNLALAHGFSPALVRNRAPLAPVHSDHSHADAVPA